MAPSPQFRGRFTGHAEGMHPVTPLTEALESPLDLEAHFPCRVAILSNLLLVDRDPLVRNFTSPGLRELRVAETLRTRWR